MKAIEVKNSAIRLLFFVIVFVSADLRAQFVVRWTDEIGVQNVDNVITKVTPSGWTNAGVTSSNKLLSRKDGAFEFTLGKERAFRIGFVSGDFYQPASNNFIGGVGIGATGIVSINEGLVSTTHGQAKSGDRFKIQRNGNILSYYWNGSLLRSMQCVTSTFWIRAVIFNTSGSIPAVGASCSPELIITKSITGTSAAMSKGSVKLKVRGGRPPYRLLWDNGETTDSISNQKFGVRRVIVTDADGVVRKDTVAIGYKVIYASCTGVVAEKGRLLKSGVNGWNGGADASNRATEGWIEFVVDQRTSSYATGFWGEGSSGLASLINGIIITGDGRFTVIEKSIQYPQTSYRIGDVFRIEKKGSQIVYSRNNEVFRRTPASMAVNHQIIYPRTVVHSGTSPAINASFDARIIPSAVVETGASISLNVTGGMPPYNYRWDDHQGSGPGITRKFPGKYRVTVTDVEGRSVSKLYEIATPMSVGNQKSVTVDGAIIQRSETAGLWNSGVVYNEVLPKGKTGWIEWVVPDGSNVFETGVSLNDAGYDYTNFRYGIAYNAFNRLLIAYEGLQQYNLGIGEPGDVLRIERTTTSINFVVNGVIARTRAADLSIPLKFKTSVNTGKAPIATCSFGKSETVVTVLNIEAFEYRYDSRRRMIASKKPGIGWVYNVYDQRDRLILQQDPNQRTSDTWSFTKYDPLDRAVVTGLISIPGADRDVVQRKADDHYLNNRLAGEITGTEVFGYTNRTYPLISDTSLCMSVLYYDNHSWKRTIADTSWLAFRPDEFSQPVDYSGRVIGLPTGARIRLSGGDRRWLLSAFYYDGSYRPIQTVVQNIKKGFSRESSEFDFTGKLVKSIAKHHTPQKTVIIEKEFEYDHGGRLTSVWHRVNNGKRVLLSASRYNEAGQLASKGLHSVGGATFLHELAFRYNIRGWLTSVNDFESRETTESRFGYKLSYQQPGTSNQTPLFNGNISAIDWRNGAPEIHQYGFTYDPMNRFKKASGSLNAGIFKEYFNEQTRYDLDGNIEKLSRSDFIGRPVDDLDYSYNAGFLTSVHDPHITQGPFAGKTNSEFKHDANGNIRSGRDDIDIKYNYLNLPDEIHMNGDTTIYYEYDALGRKLAMTITHSNERRRIEYVGELLFENDALTMIMHDEGRIVFDHVGNPEYQYFLKDHLGSVRMIISTERERKSAIATMEMGNQGTEGTEFLNYDSVTRISSMLFNHSRERAASYSIRLNGTPNEQIGLAKSVFVMPGDTVKATVYAKYISSDTSKWTPDIVFIVNSFLNVAGAGTTFPDRAGAFLSDPKVSAMQFDKLQSNSDEVPRAYLNYLFFDLNYNLVDLGFTAVSSEAEEHGQYSAWQRLGKEIVSTKAGYLYLYLSNENVVMGGARSDVFFDDFSVEHITSAVVAIQDFYPSGALAWSATRENATDNPFAFNGKERQGTTDLLDFGARLYDPVIGRWNSIDPHAGNYPGQSPYQFTLNNPVNVVDPDGKDIFLLIWFSKNNETGHAGIAIENYKTQNKKDANGNNVLDANGNVVTEQVKDGTLTYYDLWPRDPVRWNEYDSNVGADYSKGVVLKDLNELTGTDVTDNRTGAVSPEGRAADGVVRVSTTYAQDEQARQAANSEVKANKRYNAMQNNCSTFAQRVLNTAISPGRVDASQLVKPPFTLRMHYTDTNVVAPNNLYNAAMGLSGAVNIKGPSSVIVKPYLSYFGK